MNEGLVLGIDVGGTKLAGVAVLGEQIAVERRAMLTTAPLAEQVIRLARELTAEVDRPAGVVGIAVPGQVDTERGIVELAVNLGVRDLPIGSLVSDALGVPCAVEHDARAVAAWLVGQAGAPANLAYVSVGTGISAGVVVRGSLVRGGHGLAGEIGHQLADPRGARCACGLIGCLETVASGPAIVRRAIELRANDGASRLPAEPTTADIFAASAHGDGIAVRVVEDAATHLAAAIRGLALAFGPERVAVGGGVTRAGAALDRPLQAALARERSAAALVARALPPESVELITDDRPLGALGAAAVARRWVTATPTAPSAVEGEVGTR